MKTTMYRVGVMGDVPLWLTSAGTLGTVEINDSNAWDRRSWMAVHLAPKVAMTWVQVLASRHRCVVVERVEVGCG
jgi:hypothetical protein